MQFKPVDGLVLEPFQGSALGYVFKDGHKPAAYVLDQWSFTVLNGLSNMPFEAVRETIISDPDETQSRDLDDKFQSTLRHLAHIELVERTHHG